MCVCCSCLTPGGGQDPEELSLRDWQDAAAAEGEEDEEEDAGALELSLRHWDAPPAAAAEPRRCGLPLHVGAVQSLVVVLQSCVPNVQSWSVHSTGLRGMPMPFATAIARASFRARVTTVML